MEDPNFDKFRKEFAFCTYRGKEQTSRLNENLSALLSLSLPSYSP